MENTQKTVVVRRLLGKEHHVYLYAIFTDRDRTGVVRQIEAAHRIGVTRFVLWRSPAKGDYEIADYSNAATMTKLYVFR